MRTEAPRVQFYQHETPAGTTDTLILSTLDAYDRPRQILHTKVEGLVAVPPVRDETGIVVEPGQLRPDLDYALEMTAWRDRAMGRGNRTLTAVENAIDSYQLAAGDSDPRHKNALDTIRTTAQRIAGRRYRPNELPI